MPNLLKGLNEFLTARLAVPTQRETDWDDHEGLPLDAQELQEIELNSPTKYT